MRLKNDASTDTRLTRRWTLRGLSNTSMPNTWALPPSLINSVDSSRTSVDLPDPFCPRMARHSPRCIVKLSPCRAATRRLRPRLREPPSRRMNSLRRLWTWTAGTADTVDTSSVTRMGSLRRPRRADEQNAFRIGRRRGAPDVLGATTDRSTAAAPSAIAITAGRSAILTSGGTRSKMRRHLPLGPHLRKGYAWL